MFNYLIIFLWLLTIVFIFNKSKYQSLFLFSSLPLSVFDSPFNVNFFYFYYFGLIYYLINYYNKINAYLFYILFYNTVVTFLLYIFYFGQSDKALTGVIYDYLVSQTKIVGLFGIYYYLYDNNVSIKFFLKYFIPSLIISIIFGYFIYLGFDSPYFILKNFGYSTNGSVEFNIIRLSGLSQEPRYLAYLIVFGLIMLGYTNFDLIKTFFLRLFFLVSLLLTKSFSGFILLFFILSFNYFNKYTYLRFLFSLIIITAAVYFYFSFYNNIFLSMIKARIFERFIIDFDYLPSFLSIFEHHDTVALKFLENNWIVVLFGIGYGQIKNYEAVYAYFVDPSMTLFNINSTIHCCDPQSLIVNIISSFGILNFIFFIYAYFKNISKYNPLIVFIIFNFLNMPPGPLPLFILVFVIYLSINNFKLNNDLP